MNDLQQIHHKIHEIRGQRVMLDFDLAAMYGVETRVLNQSVKRNIERFPEDFMFQLTKGELEILRAEMAAAASSETSSATDWTSQIVTSNFISKGLRKQPFAFTENGVAMLSSVLRSPLSIQVNIGIMRAFTQIRRMATMRMIPDSYEELKAEIQAVRREMNDILSDQNDINESTRAQLDAISTALAELQAKEPRKHHYRRIGFIQDPED